MEKARFFCDISEDSRQAYKLLAHSDIPFTTLGPCYEAEIMLNYGYLTFVGLDGIKKFISIYGNLKWSIK